MKRRILVSLTLPCLLCLTSLAVDSTPEEPFQRELRSVAAAELPGMAAKLVKQSKPRDAAKTAAEVTRKSVAINPAAASATVGAIAHSVPGIAAVAAGTAAGEQPKQAAAIAKAAAAAAPSKVAEIVAAVCRAVPNDYRAIAIAASQAVPGSSEEILKGVAAALPGLKTALEKALARSSANSPSVAATLETVALAKDGASAPGSPPPRGPTVGPPFVPLSGSVKSVTPDTSGEVPPGGRNYARP
jgi:hypothetical protein